jgi:hypothetical protein
VPVHIDVSLKIFQKTKPKNIFVSKIIVITARSPSDEET